MLLFPIACTIIKIKRMCGHDVSAFEWISSNKDKRNPPTTSNNVGHPYTATASPSMEKAFDNLNNNSVLNPQQTKLNLEEARKKTRENFAALTSIRDACTFTPLT